MNKRINLVFPGGKKVDAQMDGMTVHTDQAVQDGGEGSAPAPFDYYFVALATCSGITAKAYCDRNHISSDGLAVVLESDWDGSTHRYDRITTKITLPHNFPEEHRERFYKRVDACVVKKHIIKAPTFVLELFGEIAPS